MAVGGVKDSCDRWIGLRGAKSGEAVSLTLMKAPGAYLISASARPKRSVRGVQRVAAQRAVLAAVVGRVLGRSGHDDTMIFSTANRGSFDL